MNFFCKSLYLVIVTCLNLIFSKPRKSKLVSNAVELNEDYDLLNIKKSLNSDKKKRGKRLKTDEKKIKDSEINDNGPLKDKLGITNDFDIKLNRSNKRVFSSDIIDPNEKEKLMKDFEARLDELGMKKFDSNAEFAKERKDILNEFDAKIDQSDINKIIKNDEDETKIDPKHDIESTKYKQKKRYMKNLIKKKGTTPKKTHPRYAIIDENNPIIVKDFESKDITRPHLEPKIYKENGDYYECSSEIEEDIINDYREKALKNTVSNNRSNFTRWKKNR